MRFRFPRFVLLIALVAFSACAHPRHVAVVVDAGMYEAVNDIHAMEQRALCGQPSCAGIAARVTPSWTDAKSQGFNQKLLPAVGGGREFNNLLGSWDPTTPVPQQVSDLINSLSAALGSVTQDFPGAGPQKQAILESIAKAQSLALTALNIVLSVKGR